VDVRFAPKADMCSAARDVRFGPKADTARAPKIVEKVGLTWGKTLSLIPEAYQSKAVRYGPNCSRVTIANPRSKNAL
jgi:hypothetical protein